MSETKSPHGGLTRRSFLKTTGAVAAATAAAVSYTHLRGAGREGFGQPCGIGGGTRGRPGP